MATRSRRLRRGDMNLIAALLLVAAVVVVILALLWLRPDRPDDEVARLPGPDVADTETNPASSSPKGVTFVEDDRGTVDDGAVEHGTAQDPRVLDRGALDRPAQGETESDLLARAEGARRRADAADLERLRAAEAELTGREPEHAQNSRGVSFRERDRLREAGVDVTAPGSAVEAAPLPRPVRDRPAVLVDSQPRSNDRVPPPLPPRGDDPVVRRADDSVGGDDRVPVIPSRARAFVRDSMGDRNVGRATADLELLGAAIVRFRSIVGRSPNRLVELTRPLPGYVDGLMGPAGLPTDPWGRDYVYDGDTGGEGIVSLYCLGSDGKRDGSGYAADLSHTPTE